MKRLIVCADGTWNTPEQEGAEDRKSTNVLKLLRAIKQTDRDGVPQIVYYHEGVGTGGFLDRWLGGGLGIGLSENVLDCYRFLANNHVEGDEIYLFGFSRGAFTVRSLAGLIGVLGFVDKVHMGKLSRGYRYYRTPHEKRPQAQALLKPLGARRLNIPIKCIGVWDTVGALGIPISFLKNIGARRFQFHDTTLGRDVQYAFHAIAIDERRKPFQPTLWDEKTLPERQSMEQVWFAGVHSNVGGGYPNDGLSDIALEWMVDRVSHGTPLEFDPIYKNVHIKPHIDGKLYDSYRRFYCLLGPSVRAIPLNAQIDDSVFRRSQMQLDVPYEPQNLPDLPGRLAAT